eukprot:g2109.t1
MIRLASATTARGLSRRFFSSLSLVKTLRKQTGAPILECKKALAHEDVNGDLDKAIDYLRALGVAAAAKRSSNDALEGLVAVETSACKTRAVAVELNSETDFVARNELFQTLLTDISMAALEIPADGDSAQSTGTADITEQLLAQPLGGDGETVSSAVEHLSGVIRENISLRRAVRLTAGPNARIGSYVHNVLAPGKGEVGCAAAIDVESGLENCDEAEVSQLGTTVSLHIAAAKPLYLNVDSIPEEDAEREKAVHMEVAMQTGKPPEIAEKMITGKMRKFYEQTVLCNQKCVVDEDGLAMTKMVNKAVKGASIGGFLRLQVGEELR